MATKSKIKTSAVYDWRTTDQQEIDRRKIRAQEERFLISNKDPKFPIFSTFKVASPSGMTYSVEIRDLAQSQHACDCVDFRTNGLGTCKHVEAVLLYLKARYDRLYEGAARTGSTRIEIGPDPTRNTLRLTHGKTAPPIALREWFDKDGYLLVDAESALPALEQIRAAHPRIRISQETHLWLENRRRESENLQMRREYESKVQSGEWPIQETKVPLFPYQREGMLHLAFKERALLADEMGLGKTIQAIAACALLHRLGKVQRVLVVTPASLKTEWEEQIQRFTDLPYHLVFGQKHQRLAAYDHPSFFNIVNYEQILSDGFDIIQRLKPDVVILDEAQRIKNWDTKTARAVKRLHSRYAFVLTGTPIENRIDEIHSIMDFINPSVLGPLFRFNREFYELNERGRPEGYKNLDQLHARIRPYMIRRRKSDVETELPERTDRNLFVRLSPEQQAPYTDHALKVARLTAIAKRRPLTQQELEMLQRELAMMRMICDTNYILDPSDRTCPKLNELEHLLLDCRENNAKVIVFSEWERMLLLVRELCQQKGIGFAWHTGSVPQRRRRGEIMAFKNDPNCRVFLSTDSGSTGLNLQNASVVINCDLPWNPAKLEQRIARAWRKHQVMPVTIVNLVSEDTIEHRMIETLSVKQALADGVLDLKGDLKSIRIASGRQAFLSKLEQLLAPGKTKPAPPPQPPLPADRSLAFGQLVAQKLNGALYRCEEHYPAEGHGSVLLVVVNRDAENWKAQVAAIHEQLFGPGKTDPLTPTHVEVMDRTSFEMMQKWAELGLLKMSVRARRPLSSEAGPCTPPPLTEEERKRLDLHRQTAQRKLKMAALLGEGGLTEESRAALLEAILSTGRALALSAHIPEPQDLGQILLPESANYWESAMAPIQEYVRNEAAAWKPVYETLGKRLQSVQAR